MKVEFLKNFSKDLDNTKTKSVRRSVIHLIELREEVESLDKIPNTKKLKGHRSACRTRIGDYRAGFFFENSTILLARFYIGKTSIKFSLKKDCSQWHCMQCSGLGEGRQYIMIFPAEPHNKYIFP